MKALYRIFFGCIWYVIVVLLNHALFFCDLRDSSSGWHFCVWLFCDSHQPSLSMGFSKKNIGGDCHFLHHGIFPTEGMNSSLLRWQADCLSLSHQGSPPPAPHPAVPFPIAILLLCFYIGPVAALAHTWGLVCLTLMCECWMFR